MYFEKKSDFHFKNPSFGKYGFWFKANFSSHKNGSKSLKYVLNFCHTYLYFKDNTWTDFCGIYVILWDLIEVKKTNFWILNFPCQARRSTGTIDRTSGRSTEPVDRCVQDVHKGQVIWPVDRAVDRLKSPHSWVGPVDRSLWPGRPGGEQLLSGSGTVDRAVDRRAQRSKMWPLEGQTGPFQLPTGRFSNRL